MKKLADMELAAEERAEAAAQAAEDRAAKLHAERLEASGEPTNTLPMVRRCVCGFLFHTVSFFSRIRRLLLCMQSAASSANRVVDGDKCESNVRVSVSSFTLPKRSLVGDKGVFVRGLVAGFKGREAPERFRFPSLSKRRGV